MTITPLNEANAASATPDLSHLNDRAIVVVGMPGCGKSTVGRKLATRLGRAFYDSDIEIEKAAAMTIPEIFAKLGEPAFRDGERKVIARLLEGKPCVLSTGGGAFMDETTRARIRERGVSVFLKVDLDILADRTSRNDNRPLLNRPDPRAALTELYNRRMPVFETADVCIEGDERPVEETVSRVIEALAATRGETGDVT